MVAPAPNYLEAGHLLSAYGRLLGRDGDDAGAQRALASAMAIAQHEGDLTLEMVTLINAASVDLEHLRLHASGEKGLRATELMDQLHDPMNGKDALLPVLRVCYNTGNLVEARQYAIRYQAIVESIGDPALITFGFYCQEKIAALGGDWTSARQFCERGLLPESSIVVLLCVRAQLEYAVGEFKQGEAFLERVVEAYRKAGPGSHLSYVYLLQTIAAIAYLTGATKHVDVAQAVAATVLSTQRVSPLTVWFARTGLGLIAAQAGDTATVTEQYQAVRGQRGALMTMDIDRLLGVLAAASGELDEAAISFEAALATWSKGRYPEYAWTAYEYADMLLQRANSGDHDRANALLDEALTLSHELGMVPLTERVLSRKESVKKQ